MVFSEIFITKKLEQMDKYLEEFKEVLALSDKEILKKSANIYVAERLFQLLVDSMIDINQHFIRELNLKVPDDLQSTFTIVGENDVLPKDFAFRIAPIVGIRNRLVHQYEEIDKELFIKNLRQNFSDFEIYQKHIKNYLSKMS